MSNLSMISQKMLLLTVTEPPCRPRMFPACPLPSPVLESATFRKRHEYKYISSNLAHGPTWPQMWTECILLIKVTVTSEKNTFLAVMQELLQQLWNNFKQMSSWMKWWCHDILVKWPILTAITQQRAGLCPYFIFGLIRNWWKFFTQFTAQVADRSSMFRGLRCVESSVVATTLSFY